MKKTKSFLKNGKALRILLSLALSVAALVLSPDNSAAVTRGEFVAGLFRELGYEAAPEPLFPPDVPRGHVYSRQIGSAVKYGLLPKDNFKPDASIDRHDAVRLALSMMGWGFEASLCESFESLPELYASGDSVFFLAAEMKPPAPSALLLDGATPLTDSGQTSLLNWVRGCRKSVSWNRVIPFGGTDFIIYRQGVACPGAPNEPGPGNPVGAARNEPLYIAAVAVHLLNADTRIAFAVSMGQERAALSDFSRAYEPIGAINGGFFSNSHPLGSMLLDGSPASKPLEGRSAVGWNNVDGSFAFGPGFARIGVRTPDGFVQFDRYNVAPQANEASFYTKGVMVAAAGAALDALELAVKDGIVTERREGSWGNHFLPPGASMIVARGNSRALLERYMPGDGIPITSDWDTPSFGGCTDVIQAGPMLTRGNQILRDKETFKDDITAKRHPRTIVGTDGERVIWAVIDGRSSIHSRGASIDETRLIAHSLGLSTAINLDGGGSSELIWRGIVTNIPSDGKERPLPYAVLMMPKGAPLVQQNSGINYEYGNYAPPAVAPESPSNPGEAEFMDTYNPNAN
ncbi:MAG: phosphodiester glycosidase family protein [Synergistaceae bacterium]|jgi:hypothetical protein|nr:phosphodiester glycosidase family protein [Synergistaceae bacterium]